MTEEQQKALAAPFAPAQVKQREGSFGQVLDYLEGHAVIQRLNEVLGGLWSFEVSEYQVLEESSEVFVLGKLSVEGVSRTQFGSSRITRNEQTGEILSLADDLKAAATDALKKCATLLGVGLYLYNGESRPEGTQADPGTERKPGSLPPSFKPSPGSDKARLSGKQLKLIQKLTLENGISRQELNRHCQEAYGRVVEFLSRSDASRVIESLFSGEIKPGHAA